MHYNRRRSQKMVELGKWKRLLSLQQKLNSFVPKMIFKYHNMEITYDNYPNHNKINDFDDSNNFSQDATKMSAHVGSYAQQQA